MKDTLIICIIMIVIIIIYFMYYMTHTIPKNNIHHQENFTNSIREINFDEINVDILIVGGGPSGIYSAWRLSQAYPEKKIIVVEEKSFLGGRLESIYFGNTEIYAEMGGMRTFPNTDIYLTALLKKLNKPTIERPYIRPNNTAYFKNTRFMSGVVNISSSANPQKQLLIQTYKIPPREYNLSNNMVIDNAVEIAAPGYQTNPRSVFYSNTLNNQTFVEMLKNQYVSNASIEIFHDFSGYNFSVVAPLAASMGIRENISISGIDKQHFVVGGYASFVDKMAQETFIGKNVHLLLSTKLKKIIPNSIGFNTCVLESEHGCRFIVKAKSVILAIPKAGFDKLDIPVTPIVQQAMASLSVWRAFKAFLLVDELTYRILSRNYTIEGRCVSDLPARQIWLYTKNPPCVLVYCDDDSADFWYRYTTSKINNEYPQIQDPETNIPLVSELVRQISIVFGVKIENICVKEIIYKYWNAGAYFSKPSDIPVLLSESKTPLGKEYNVFMVGSDISYSQGWVDGAIETADNLLVERYNLESILNF
ncbi:flavin-containing amine oxidoreductase/tryptophan 2-monooxygenase [Cotonvirus japonicus]|uniref:Flavin-containing amine oxidoreductase/tryptophan 2-monooxygenase n=1 Tax=Cotonvirus japonicus TaxID=2811091 RepID=A0ABM7NTV7_9VIRU|nr:flavin-containing amine oxidoreductase/tryptophan 2-monooxygenase [Cotonvirus japonicus]BCS83507.1 flavin-containing amine oxidoreductase/tryptophan 2-monooxygenase [Cotonvirus japonicus]